MEGKELQDMGRKVMKLPMMAPPFFRFSTPAPETSLTPKSLFRYADGMKDSLSEGIFNGQEVSKTILLRGQGTGIISGKRSQVTFLGQT